MQILWHNIVALMLVIIAVILLITHWHEIGVFVAGMGQIGPGSTTEQKTYGLIALGLVGVIIVALAKILSSHNRGDR